MTNTKRTTYNHERDCVSCRIAAHYEDILAEWELRLYRTDDNQELEVIGQEIERLEGLVKQHLGECTSD